MLSEYMKIVFLARRFWPDQGGVEKHVYELSKRLIEKGHKVTVVTQSQGEINQLDGIDIKRIPKTDESWFEKFQIWKWMLLNQRLFKEAKIIHAHDVYFWYWPLKLIFPGKKSFVTFHGYETYPISKKAVLIRKISEKLADGNIIVGDFIKKWYGTAPDYVIYGAVEIPKNIFKPRKTESAVFIGRLDEHTGVLEYEKAVDLIKKTNPKFEFRIIGEGKYKKRLDRYNPLGFKENAFDFLMASNFAFVSRYLSILEAFASKRMVFALYDNPVKEDYLKMTPFSKFIVTADRPDKLARKVAYFLDKPKQVKKFTDEGYGWVKSLTWQNLTLVYLKLWR